MIYYHAKDPAEKRRAYKELKKMGVPIEDEGDFFGYATECIVWWEDTVIDYWLDLMDDDNIEVTWEDFITVVKLETT